MCPIHFTRLKEGDVGHFHGIGSNNVFFGYGYFCLKHYNNKGKHWCQTTCNVCCNDHCISGIERSCRYYHRTCRSLECYQRHANRTDTRGRESEKSSWEKTYQCRNCRKILEKSRKPRRIIEFFFLRLRNDTKRNDIVWRGVSGNRTAVRKMYRGLQQM